MIIDLNHISVISTHVYDFDDEWYAIGRSSAFNFSWYILWRPATQLWCKRILGKVPSINSALGYGRSYLNDCGLHHN